MEELRKKCSEKSTVFKDLLRIGDLEGAILDIYYRPTEEEKKGLEIIKQFAIRLTIANAEYRV